ncbi:EamA family transporter RarD [Enterococcus sp. DIV0242_7C1]|uniref:Protein RarD n=1 Tax=Candidatus Enterococcus dunnyi TaxID=1834192 RepID=A0A200J9T9_9ENTE|nr:MULTISPECIES: EamA family transporter RarD [unclassified Enterococcus]MBO0470919.1 EamA family transporter RarD [Enterococcus sp. DIV0242_7C1]MCA5013155.1 EamA family transporter RarD [Enterococcus sp. S23]MCA5016405.1 EamA family transporter RarD [Enterococcus sp. S22(2020)]OUZ33367.1 protein RarD [Enterococcus sp. 9D6_DIV0238]
MKEQRKGVLLGFIAYIFWGVIPIYWKLMPMVDPLDILCYRIVWSFLFMLIYIFVTKKWTLFLAEVKSVLKEKKKLFAIICAAILISLNWFTFIYTVSQGHVTQASLGYYMNPLVNVLLATLILKEKLSRSGLIACGLALTGVVLLTIQTGQLPLAPLIMAVTFSFYGLIKKGVSVSSYTGLTIETFVILPLALIYLIFFSKQGFMNYELSTNLLLVGAGVVTAIPLLLFAEAAKKISYIILGFIQYVGPTLMLLSALFIYHEPYSLEQFMAFGFIWLGIAVFTYGNIYTYRKEKRFVK